MGATISGISEDVTLFQEVAQNKKVPSAKLQKAAKTGIVYIKVILRAFIILCFIVVAFGFISSAYLLSANEHTITSHVWKTGALGLGIFTLLLFLSLLGSSVYVLYLVEKNIDNYSSVLSKLVTGGVSMYHMIDHKQLPTSSDGTSAVPVINQNRQSSRQSSVSQTAPDDVDDLF